MNNDTLKDTNNDLTEQYSSSPYMGDIRSKDIGTLPYAGRLGGEMVRRMIKAQEEKLIEQYTNDQMKS